MTKLIPAFMGSRYGKSQEAQEFRIWERIEGECLHFIEPASQSRMKSREETGGGVDDGGRPEALEQVEHALAVADVEFVVGERRAEVFREAGLVPAGIALRAEEDRALVVVDAVDVPTELGEVDADFGADESGGTGDEEFFHGEEEECRRRALGALFLVLCGAWVVVTDLSGALFNKAQRTRH